ncbi:MAG: hypothetical protein U0667_09420 [Chloroflexota bacterium]
MTDPAAPPSPVLDLRARGWRQGSIPPQDLAVELCRLTALAPLATDDHLVVISHDCDICHPDIAKEPDAELIVVRRLPARPSGDWTFMRSPRVLEFEAQVGGQSQSFRVAASERLVVPRTRLVGVDPAAHLETQPPDLLVAWLTNRYIRRAFPDAFNDRLRAKRKDIERPLKGSGEHLHSIYLLIDDDELSPDVSYRLVVRGTMLESDFAVPERRIRAQQAFDGLVAALGACPGIEVVDDALVSETEISLHDIRIMKRWSVHDSLSLRSEDEAYARIEPTR